MAGKYGSASTTVTLNDHGGTPRIITGHIRTMGGVKISQITEENSPFGVAYEMNTPVGKQKFGPVTFAGDWDTTANTGPHAVFGTLETTPQDTARVLVIVPGDSKTLTVSGYVVEFELVFNNGKLTGYTAQFVQSSLAVWS